MTKGKIMKSGPTTSWKKVGEKAEAETDFLCSGSIFTADSDSRHRIRIFFSLDRKAMAYLEIVHYTSVKLKKSLFV